MQLSWTVVDSKPYDCHNITLANHFNASLFSFDRSGSKMENIYELFRRAAGSAVFQMSPRAFIEVPAQ